MAADEHPAHDEEPVVRVCLLGPAVVEGAARPFRRPWSLDLVAYLALHREGAATESWTTALWPDRLPSPATCHSVASAARRSLGSDGTGADHLPRRRGRLRLGPSVGSDVDQLLQAARSPEPRAWVAGLALVRGRPFDGLRAPDWPILEGCSAMVEGVAAELALRLASWHQATGRHDEAAAAARAALLACPFDERLYRCLLTAARAAGNPGAADAAMAELCCRLGAPAGRVPFDLAAWVDPATEALYRALPGRGAASKRVRARL